MSWVRWGLAQNPQANCCRYLARSWAADPAALDGVFAVSFHIFNDDNLTNRLHCINCIGACRPCEAKSFYFPIYCSPPAWETNISFQLTSHLYMKRLFLSSRFVISSSDFMRPWLGRWRVNCCSLNASHRASLGSDWCATIKIEMGREREEKSLCALPEHSLKMSKPPPAEIVSKYNPEASTPRSRASPPPVPMFF